MNFQNCFTAAYVWAVNVDLSIKTAWTKKCWVQNVRTVCCSHNDDVCACIETVHFYQKLVQCLFSFVVTATKACATLTTNCVDFVNKDDARHVLFGLVKQISYTACAYADKHFYKVGTTHGEEWYTCFACNGFSKQCFTCSWRTYKQHALGDACAHICKAFWVFEEVDNFLEFFLFFFGAGNVSKANLHVCNGLCTRVAEIHVLVVLACDSTENEKSHTNDKCNVQRREDVVCPTALVRVGSKVLCVSFSGELRLQNELVEACSVGSDKTVHVVLCIDACNNVAVEFNFCKQRNALTECCLVNLFGIVAKHGPNQYAKNYNAKNGQQCRQKFVSFLFQNKSPSNACAFCCLM